MIKYQLINQVMNRANEALDILRDKNIVVLQAWFTHGYYNIAWAFSITDNSDTQCPNFTYHDTAEQVEMLNDAEVVGKIVGFLTEYNDDYKIVIM